MFILCNGHSHCPIYISNVSGVNPSRSLPSATEKLREISYRSLASPAIRHRRTSCTPSRTHSATLRSSLRMIRAPGPSPKSRYPNPTSARSGRSRGRRVGSWSGMPRTYGSPAERAGRALQLVPHERLPCVTRLFLTFGTEASARRDEQG